MSGRVLPFVAADPPPDAVPQVHGVPGPRDTQKVLPPVIHSRCNPRDTEPGLLLALPILPPHTVLPPPYRGEAVLHGRMAFAASALGWSALRTCIPPSRSRCPPPLP
jgi:hypothetical protein